VTLDELIPLIARLFSSRGYRYFTLGGVGVSLWGRPRTTRDLDVVVRLERGAVPAFVAELNKAGFRITRPLHRKLAEGRLIQLTLGATELDIRLCAKGHDMEALARAKRAAFEGFDLWVARPEDIVLYKLQSWRTQDQADIENLIANVKALDRRYIGNRLAAIEEETGHPVRERWKEILRRPSP
jgi:hypothetical protein